MALKILICENSKNDVADNVKPVAVTMAQDKEKNHLPPPPPK